MIKLFLIRFQTSINIPLDRLPVNTALVLLIDPDTSLKNFRTKAAASPTINDHYNVAMQYMEQVIISFIPKLFLFVQG
jgi:hypothetical protein